MHKEEKISTWKKNLKDENPTMVLYKERESSLGLDVYSVLYQDDWTISWRPYQRNGTTTCSEHWIISTCCAQHHPFSNNKMNWTGYSARSLRMTVRARTTRSQVLCIMTMVPRIHQCRPFVWSMTTNCAARELEFWFCEHPSSQQAYGRKRLVEMHWSQDYLPKQLI